MLRLGAGLEAKASDLFAQPNSDNLLIVGVQHGSVEWVELLLWRVRQTINTGRLQVITLDFCHYSGTPLKRTPMK